jgi:DNA polymerase-3 subunit beta
MKFGCQSSLLQKAVNIVEKAVPERTSVPVLENIYLSLHNNELTLRGNNMEIGIEYKIPVENMEIPGTVLVKAKTISSILSKLSNQVVTISVDSNFKMKITGENVDFDLLCLSVEEYPIFPEIQSGDTISIKISDLREMLARTLFSVSTDETKQFLNGILFRSFDSILHLVATDGYRLALKKTAMESLGDMELIVPFKALNELNKIIQGLEPDSVMTVSVSQRQLSFSMDNFLMVSRVLDGKFPDFRQVLPQNPQHAFYVSRRALLDACERANIIATFSNNVIRVSLNDEAIAIRSNASAMGDFFESMKLSRLAGNGESRISFNVKLLLDALRNMDSDDVKISFNDGLSPCLLEPVSGGDYLYVVMPIRTNDYQEVQPQASQEAPDFKEPEPIEEPTH